MASMARVAVVGAAGYVGQYVSTRLRAEHDVTGVIRPSSGFLLDRLEVPWVDVGRAPAHDPFDAVVNLAYPTGGSVYDHPHRNRELASAIARLARPGGQILHVSTQAVFGLRLELAPVPQMLPLRRDLLYVETKLEQERLIAAIESAARIDIIRLGNVWGPASSTWTAELARRLLFEEPVSGPHDSPSNVTDVANVASYIAYLISREDGGERIRFHHLAELGDQPWSVWIKRMSDQLNVTPVRGDVPEYPETVPGEVSAILRAHSPKVVARELKDTRLVGSAVRSAIGSLPATAQKTIRSLGSGGSGPADGGGEFDFYLAAAAVQRRFADVLDSQWTPPVDVDASWAAVSRWLDEAGYT
jgi:dTDP-4-dehydrorhamnose reductase